MSDILNSKTFTFDKIAFYGKKRINTPTLEVELRNTNKGIEFSVCGNIWNATHTDIVCGGQCLDTMIKFSSLANNELFMKIYKLWKVWHLNSMHPGTVAQEEALANFTPKNQYDRYEEDCAYLDSIGLLVDNGYKYGSAWLHREIPDDVLAEMKSLFD